MPRFFEEFNKEYAYDFPGESSHDYRLWIANKKLKYGDEPNKNKYQKQYFIKKVKYPLQNGKHEVAIMEFYRLLLPIQPKYRFIQDIYQLDSYVQSTAIQYGDSVLMLGHNALRQQCSPWQYGKTNGLKGLGALECIGKFILDNRDNHLGNLIVDNENQLYKIDGKGVYWQHLSPHHSSSLKNKFSNLYGRNTAYTKEFNRVLLRFITLPEMILNTFCQNYFVNQEDKIALFANQIFLRHLCQTKIRDDQHFFYQFKEYCCDTEAEEDLEAYVSHLKNFTHSGKMRLFSDLSHIQKQLFENLNKIKEGMRRPFTLNQFQDLQTQQASLNQKLMNIKKEFENHTLEFIHIDCNIYFQLNRMCQQFFTKTYDILDYKSSARKFKNEIEKLIEHTKLSQPKMKYVTLYRPIFEQISGLLLLMMTFGFVLLIYGGLSYYAHHFFIKKKGLIEPSVSQKLTKLLDA